MDRASSIFLDKFAVDKLLSDKLEQVSHKPGGKITTPLFGELENIEIDHDDFNMTDNKITFSSGYDRCVVDIYNSDNAKGHIIFVHGLYEDNKDIYKFLFSMLNKAGYTVYLLNLPHHYERKETLSLFSGEYFWSADFKRTREAFRQAVFDLYKFFLYLGSKNGSNPDICGFSMGAAVVFNLASRIELKCGITLLNTVTNLSEQSWKSDLWRTIKRDFIRSGYTIEDIAECFKEMCPSGFEKIKTPVKSFYFLNGEFDQIVKLERTYEFFLKWSSIKRDILKCGHLNMLRVPKLANIIDKFNLELKEVIKDDKLLSVSL